MSIVVEYMLNMPDAFAAFIVQELQSRGWSMRELARRGGISAAVISQVISGSSSPGLEFCKAVAQAFKMPPEVILYRAGLLPEPAQLDANLAEAIHLFNYLSKEDQETTLAWLRFLLERQGKMVSTNK